MKNDYSNRVIPIVARALEALVRSNSLRPSLPSPKIQPLKDHVSVNSHGVPYTDKTWMEYGRAISKAIRVWKSKIDWKAKDLRNCIPTFAHAEGIHSDLWEQYIGHAPRNVTATNYLPRMACRSRGEREAFGERLAILIQHIVKRLNEAILGNRKLV